MGGREWAFHAGWGSGAGGPGLTQCWQVQAGPLPVASLTCLPVTPIPGSPHHAGHPQGRGGARAPAVMGQWPSWASSQCCRHPRLHGRLASGSLTPRQSPCHPCSCGSTEGGVRPCGALLPPRPVTGAESKSSSTCFCSRPRGAPTRRCPRPPGPHLPQGRGPQGARLRPRVDVGGHQLPTPALGAL